MNVGSAFVADSDPPEAVQPREAPFHYPAVATEFLAALHSSARDSDVDASVTQELPAARIIIALVRMEFVWPFSRSAAMSFHGFHRVDEFLEQLRIVDIGSGDSSSKRDASPIDHQMVFGASPTPVYRVWAGVLTPFSLGW